MCDDPFLTPSLLFIEGNKGALACEVAWASRNRLLEPIRKHHVEAGGERAQCQVGRPRWSADLWPPSFAPKFGQVTDEWALGSVLGDLAQNYVCCMLWWVHGSLCLRLIGRDVIASDR